MTGSYVVCICVLSVAMFAGRSGPAMANATERQPGSNRVLKIDADKTGEPISKYVYGQFLENLPGVVYQSIWAEMILDRKFYTPVGKEVLLGGLGSRSRRTTWQPVGPAESVTMVRQGSYVGDHSPQITVAGQSPQGIMQGGLRLFAAREYEGRIVLSGSGAVEVEVSLVWGTNPTDRQTVTIDALSADYTTTALTFTADDNTFDGRLEIVGRGEGTFRVGTVSLMPANNTQGMRAETLKLLKEMDGPIYRWPGGNFVSGYDWRDGVGDRDTRPPRWDFAWNLIEPNDFGLDEFIMFCRLIKTEPYIAVNSGFGDAQSAAAEVEYANGSADTPMGGQRAANGHPEPYNVKWWGIGNEMFGTWQLGYMSLEHYTVKHNLFAIAMREVDSSIKIIGVGNATDFSKALGINPILYHGPDWSEGMLKDCSDHMDFISEHFYWRQREDITDRVRQVTGTIRNTIATHRELRDRLESLKGKNIRIAIDEWNTDSLELKNGIGVAASLHEMIRNSDLVFMGNYTTATWCIRFTGIDAALSPAGEVLKLYRHHFGILPTAVTGDAHPLDVVAAWTPDRGALTLAIINPSTEEQHFSIDLKNATLTGAGQLWQITGPDESVNPQEVFVKEEYISNTGGIYSVPPSSISLYELPSD